MRISSNRPLIAAGVLGLVLAGAVPATAVSPPTTERKGAAGAGDRYYPKDGNGGYQVEKYVIDANYRPDGQRLIGKTQVRAKSTVRLSRFNLDLMLRASSVTVNGAKAAFTQGKHELVVTPRKPIAKGATFKVRVAYAGRPAELQLRGERPFIADRSGALVAGEPIAAPWWFPSNDHPSDKAKFDITLRAPKGWQAISNGELAGKKKTRTASVWHWTPHEPMTTYLAFAAWGRYDLERYRTASGMRVVDAVDKALGARQVKAHQRALRFNETAIDFIAARYGNYPYSDLGGIVPSQPFPGALENATRPVYGYTSKDVIVHELAHQWFGNHVAPYRWRDIWLNEGLATYVQREWTAATRGPSLDRQFEDLYNEPDWGQWRVKPGNPGPGRIFDIAVYERGAMTIHALGKKVGADTLNRILRAWAQQNDGWGTTAEFRALAERISGTDLDSLFTEYLFTSGKPEHW